MRIPKRAFRSFFLLGAALAVLVALAPPAAADCTCTDNDPCTTDTCLNCIFGNCFGGCAHVTVPNGTGCDDSVFCNGVDFCIQGQCVHTGNPCPGAAGTVSCFESCHEPSDTCTAIDPIGSTCNDSVFCNGADTCGTVGCTGHAGNPCPGPDHDADCSESCNEEADSCTANDPLGALCDDGVFCNGTDSCGSGICGVHVGDPCAEPLDGDCTDSCDEIAEDCIAIDPNGTPCSDGVACTGDDRCQGGSCIAGAPGSGRASGLVFTGPSNLSWAAVPVATTYDVVRGTLSLLAGAGFASATDACTGPQVFGTSLSDTHVPPPRGTDWFLVRPDGPCGPGTYDDGSPSQAASRDTGIAASPNACP